MKNLSTFFSKRVYTSDIMLYSNISKIAHQNFWTIGRKLTKHVLSDRVSSKIQFAYLHASRPICIVMIVGLLVTLLADEPTDTIYLCSSCDYCMSNVAKYSV